MCFGELRTMVAVRLGVCLLAFLPALDAGSVYASEWTNAAGDQRYANDLNWNPTGKPGSEARWNDIGGAVVFEADEQSYKVLIDNNAVRWELNGWRYDVSGDLAVSPYVNGCSLTAVGGSVLTNQLHVGSLNNQVGTLALDSGCDWQTQSLYMGDVNGRSGLLTLDGGSSINVQNDLILGSEGEAEVRVLNGDFTVGPDGHLWPVPKKMSHWA